MVFLRQSIPTLVVFACLTLAWYGVSATDMVNAYLLPSPQKVAAAFGDLSFSGTLAKHMAASLRRVGIGYGLSVLIAMPLAAAFVLSRPIRTILEPISEFLRQVPPLALMPLLMLWLGIGEAQKVGIIVLACFFPIFLGVRGGIAQVDPKLIEVAKVCGLGRVETMRRIVLPSAFPSLMIGLRIGLGYSWRALVGAELIASSAGLGYMITDAQDLARTDIVLTGIIVIGLIGLVADHLLKRLCTYLAPWTAGDAEVANA